MKAADLDPAIAVLEVLNRLLGREVTNAQDAAERFAEKDPEKAALYSGVATVGRILCAVTYGAASTLQEQRDELAKRTIN